MKEKIHSFKLTMIKHFEFKMEFMVSLEIFYTMNLFCLSFLAGDGQTVATTFNHHQKSSHYVITVVFTPQVHISFIIAPSSLPKKTKTLKYLL